MMTIEEKARAYDEALEKVRNIQTGKCKTTFTFTEGLFEYIFTALKESEDERIRKELIEYFRWNVKQILNEFSNKKCIAWLEKQGEQILANSCKTCKDGPKFRVGDKIRKKAPSSCDKDMQVSRICNDHYICNHIGKFSSEPIPFSEESYYELIEQKWSEEDEYYRNIILYCLNNQAVGEKDKENAISWLKGFDNRTFPRRREDWSEEDACNFKLVQMAISSYFVNEEARKEAALWLYAHCNAYPIPAKLLYHWIPSDEQLEALKNAIHLKPFENPSDNLLLRLYEQLKKLKE